MKFFLDFLLRKYETVALFIVSPKPFLIMYIFWNKPVLSRCNGY